MTQDPTEQFFPSIIKIPRSQKLWMQKSTGITFLFQWCTLRILLSVYLRCGFRGRKSRCLCEMRWRWGLFALGWAVCIISWVTEIGESPEDNSFCSGKPADGKTLGTQRVKEMEWEKRVLPSHGMDQTTAGWFHSSLASHSSHPTLRLVQAPPSMSRCFLSENVWNTEDRSIFPESCLLIMSRQHCTTSALRNANRIRLTSKSLKYRVNQQI